MRPFAKRTAALLASGLLFMGAANLHAQDQVRRGPQPALAPVGAPMAGVALEDDTAVATIDGETFTVADIRTAWLRRGLQSLGVQPMTDIPLLRGERLKEVAGIIGAWDHIAAEAKAAGLEIGEEELADANRQASGGFDRHLYREFVTDKLETATEEELLATYESVKDARFRNMEEWRMRHIFVSTYVPYTVKAGDTLESIAKEMSGDAALADKILSAETKRPRTEVLEATAEDGTTESLPAKGLAEGEELLVPGSGGVVEKAKGKIEEAHAALEAGEDFVTVAGRYSESEKPGEVWAVRPATQDREIIPDITETFFSLQDGQYSGPLRTKHGYQIIWRERYQEESYTPFDEVRPYIERLYNTEETKEKIADFFDMIVSSTGAIAINMDAWKLPAGERSSDDVLLTINGEDVTRAQIGRAVEMVGAEPNEGSIIRAISNEGLVRNLLLQAFIATDAVQGDPAYQRLLTMAKNAVLANKWIESQVAEKMAATTDEDLTEYYNERKDQYTQKEAYDLYRIQVLAAEEGPGGQDAKEFALESVSSAIAGVTSVDEFREKAKTLGRDQVSRRGGSMGYVQTGDIPVDHRGHIAQVERPGATKPFVDGSAVFVYWVHDMRPAKVYTLEERRADVEASMRQTVTEELRESTLRAQAKKVDVKILPAAMEEAAAPESE